MSVTTLYKTAAQEQNRARAAGYQDALDELLTFLDRENLGLGDGEGWRVRQWATERFDGSAVGRAEDEYDDEEPEEKLRSTSPEMVKESQAATQTIAASETQHVASQQQQAQSHAPAVTEQSTTDAQAQSVRFPHVPPAFVFQSSHPYPTNHDREINMDSASVTSETPSHTHDTNSETPVRLEHASRSARTRHSRQTNNNRPTSGRVTLGAGAGSKRKTPFGDFFDISGLSFDGNGRDGSDRGGKRGRHV